VAATLRFLQFLSLGTWVGSILFFSFVVAPGAFSLLPTTELAGNIVGYSLGRLHVIGVVAGIVYLVAMVAAEKSIGALARPAALLVFAMVVLTVISQHVIIGRMDVLRLQMAEQMGSVSATPLDNPLRVTFDRLHRISVRLEGTVLLSGLVAMFFTARVKS